MWVVRGRPPRAWPAASGAPSRSVLSSAQGLPGAEVADEGPALRCPHGVPPGRGWLPSWGTADTAALASSLTGLRGLLKRPLRSPRTKRSFPSPPWMKSDSTSCIVTAVPPGPEKTTSLNAVPGSTRQVRSETPVVSKKAVSRPGPPSTRSLPSPRFQKMSSGPVPPSIRSAPPLPLIRSPPPRPEMVSGPFVPLRKSCRSVPVIVAILVFPLPRSRPGHPATPRARR